MKILDTILKIEKKNRSSLEIIGWWEVRRILYNLIVLISGIISLGIMKQFVDLPPGEDLVEPLAIIGFGIMCNLGYTLGWITEINKTIDNSYGPKMFKFGLYFTLFWIFLPAIIHIIL